ncbi:MAG: multiheme c-type cytochrome [Phycisphaeraceae bacterium]
MLKLDRWLLTTLVMMAMLTGNVWGQAIDKEGDALEAALLERASKVVGPTDFANSCVECHAAEVDAWRNTKHFATYAEMHRTEEAREIIRALGGRSIKRDAMCLQCHYSSVENNGRLRAMWGISCESCHGQAEEWGPAHALVGGEEGAQQMTPGESSELETPEQREARLTQAASQGMIHSGMIYHIATNCFGCHTVPDEQLVNEGGHQAGSDFDLVAWSQGEVRHTFLSSSDGHTNQPPTAERKRVLYVVGVLVDMEFTLRNLAKSTEEGTFREAMRERANGLQTRIDALLEAMTISEVAEVKAALPETFDTSITVDAELVQTVATAAQAFAENNDGSDLAAIDEQIPGEDAYKGDVYTP